MATCLPNRLLHHYLGLYRKTIPFKADRLNAELTKASVYTVLDQKQITAWLDLRNKASHGKYDEFNKEQVRLMISGIIEFIARVSI